MQYICHKSYNKKGACGKMYDIKSGELFESIGRFIACDNRAICNIKSEDAFRHFSRNDDGRGMERGDLTYFIAYSERRPNNDNGFRFTDKEREMLITDYPQFIVDIDDYILFNYDFFNADIDTLKEIKRKLEAA